MLKFSYLFCVLAAAVVTVLAYDFRDSDFNQYLFDDLQADYDDEEPEVLLRARREAKGASSSGRKVRGRRWWKRACCTLENLDQAHLDQFNWARKQCHQELHDSSSGGRLDPFDCRQMQQIKQKMVCINECIAKKLNATTENGDLNREVILQQLRKTFDNTAWRKEAIDGFVDKCLAESKQESAPQEPKTCKLAPLEFHYCLWREVSNNCPAEQRIDSSKCNEIRERLAKEDTSWAAKYFLHNLFISHHEK